MFNGLKARRRLAVYVALGLSAGSCTCLDASSAYAAHDYTETATSISGLEGTDKTNSMSDNNITIGTPGTPNVPFSTYGRISGGGKQNTTADVTGNTLTIHGLRVSNGSGFSIIYGGISGTGAVTNNRVFFNNGLSKDPIYGGFNGATATKAVTGNSVTVAGGTVEGDAFGGVTQGTGAVTGNSVTITGGTLKDEAAGGVVTNASNSADITGNTLTISGGAFTKSGGTKVFGAYTAGSGKAENNSATVGGIDNTNLNVYGAYAAGAGNAVNNHVTITGTGKVGGVYAGRAQSAAGKAERNTITIEPGGWAENNIFGGYAKGGVKGNIVNIKGTVNATAYGGRLMGSGTAEANEVHLEDAMVKNQVIGAEGDDGALVKENRISVANSLVKEDVIGGFSRGTTGKAEGNTVSVTGDSARVKGSVTGGHAAGDSAAVRNTISLAGGTFERNVYGGHGLQNGTVTDNTVSVSGGVLEGNIFGGYSEQNGTVSGNRVLISGGTINQFVFGGATQGTNTVEYNVVTIAGGTFAKSIYGGFSWHASGKTENNTVNLGDDTHTDLSGTTLANSYIYGGNMAATGNTLNVNARNVAVYAVNNFENYKFKLNSATVFGDTMLTVTDAGDFAGTGVDWSKLTVDRTALSDVSSLHGIQRVTLLKRSNAADTLKFQNYGATENGTATETHEFGLVTDTDTDEANAALFEVSRFKGSEVAYNGTTETYQGVFGSEIYGGLSRYGHTTESNTLTVTGLRGTDDPQYAFGGINKGATGDVKNNTLNIDLANAGDTIDEVYAGEAENANNTGEVSGNSANMKKGTVNKLYGGHTFGTGAVKDNIVNFSGGTATDYVAGAYVDNTANAADVTGNKVVFTGGTADAVEGGAGNGTGALKNNTVTFSGAGSTADTLRGANSEGQGLVEENGVTISGGTAAHAYGAVTDGTGIATKNYVTVSGGTVNTEVAGGVGYNVTANTVTISGGTVSGDVYGGKSSGPGSSTSGNVVNLGAADGTYTADLTNATLHGDNNSGTGATLNVRAKNITAKSADKFANYTFHLNDDIAQNGGSMLTLTENNGFNGGNLFDWTKLDVDTSRLSGNTVIGSATLLTGTTNGLKFSNYAGRNKTTAATNGDYETALRTDTNTGTASKVILDYNRFQNNTNATYDGSTPATTLPDGTTEVYGGISYAGNTTTNNHLTITNLQADLTFAYGGKTAALAGNTVNNSVTVTGTGSKKIDNINGGFTGAANGVAEKNRVIIKGGTVTNAIGGAASGANGSATGNEVTVEGGTVTGYVVGGDTRVLASTSNKNVINLGDDTGTYTANLSSAQIWGTSYAGNVLANDDTKLADNTLNVKGKNGAEVAKVRNVQKFNFLLHDDTTKTAPLLNMTDADGFGKVSADNSDVNVAWANVTADPSGITTATDTATVQGKNTYTLMRGANNALKFSDYVARYAVHGGVYETWLRTDTGTNTATEVLYDVNRFKDGRVTYTAASTGDALGGYSAFGNTTEGNKLTVEGVTGSLAAVYGAQTAGTAGGSVNNTVTLAGTGTGSIANVYGGAVTNAANAADVTGNTVTITGGTVTGAVYGGHTVGTGKTTGNAVNIGDGSAATLAAGTNLDNAALYGGNKADDVTGNTLNVRDVITAGQIANFEKLNFAVNRDTAGKTLLTVNGGAATTGLDWAKLTTEITTADLPTKSYGATRVTLMANDKGIDFGTTYDKAKDVVADDVYEFSVDKNNTSVYADGYRFKDNKLATFAATDGTHAEAWGGKSVLGKTAEGNVLTITSGTITDTAYGGTSSKGKAQNNKLVMHGGDVQTLKGGFGESASGNTVDVSGGTVRGDVYGGHATAGDAASNTVNLLAPVTVGGVIHGGKASAASTNNTIAVHAFGTTAKDIDNVQNLHFYLPAGTTSAETRTMLTLTNAPAVKDISTLNLGVAAVAADARALRPGDAVSLLKTNGTLTTAAQLRNTGNARTMTASHGGILDYTLGLAKRGENELIATVERVDVNSRSKSPVETRAAATAMINMGADFLTNAGMAAAADAASHVISSAAVPAASSGEGTKNTEDGFSAVDASAAAGANAAADVSGAFQPWAAQGGSAMRIHSGSYVDAKGWNLNVGFARTNKMGDATLTYGPFVEYGRGTYDSYLDDGTHGDGSMHYIGGGMMAKMAQDSGLYVEGSLRAGRVSSDYTGSDDAAELSYDNASSYFAGHVGVGQEWKLAGGDKIEGYAKYFYSHQAGDTVKLRSGADLEFGGVDSHRLRVGARYTHAVDGGSELYAGLAYEHEFGGDAAAMYQGYSTPSPSLGGGTGILELGYRFAPKDGRVSYGVNLMGMTGQREGIAGGAQVTWAF